MATNGTGEKKSKKRRLSAEEIGQMSTSDMRAALTAAVSELEEYDEVEREDDDLATTTRGGGSGHGGGIDGTLQLILAELQMIRMQRTEERAEMVKIRAECDELRTVVTQQQHFMEQLDSRDRERNLIITGLPEKEGFDGAVNDQGKCRKVIEIIGAEGVS